MSERSDQFVKAFWKYRDSIRAAKTQAEKDQAKAEFEATKKRNLIRHRKRLSNFSRKLDRIERCLTMIENGQKVGIPEMHALIELLGNIQQNPDLRALYDRLSEIESRAINATAEIYGKN